MPGTCCMPGCTSNYQSALKAGKDRVSVFHFPKDENLKSQWLKAIPRKYWSPTKYSVVCANHFIINDVIREESFLSSDGTLKKYRCKPKLSPTAVPCIFPNLPPYFSKTVPIPQKSPAERNIEYQKRTEQLNQAFEESRKRDKIRQPMNSNIFYIVEKGETEDVENRANMESHFVPTNSNDNSSELGIQITEVHSVTQELENFINFEVDTDDAVEGFDLTSEHFLQGSDHELTKKKKYHSDKKPGKDNGQGKHIDEIRDEDASRDSDDDTFEEEITNSGKTEAREIPLSDDETTNDNHSRVSNDTIYFIVLNSEEPPNQELMNDNDSKENTGTKFRCSNNKESSYDDDNKNSKDGNLKVSSNKNDKVGIRFVFFNDKESLNGEHSSNDRKSQDSRTNFTFVHDKDLGDCLVVDLSNDAEKIMQKTADINEANNITAKKDSECILISEGENSSDVENMAGMDNITDETPLFHMPESMGKEGNSANVDVDQDITEKYVLENFLIIDEKSDVPERLKDSKKITVQSTNSSYPCPLNCPFLATDRESIIEHLISHERKRKLQEKNDYQCPLCPYKTIDKDEFVHHIVYHKEPYFACNNCDYVGPKLSSLKVHMFENHGATLSCDNCHYKVKELGRYFGHQLRCVMGLTRKSKRRRRESDSEDEIRCHFHPCPFTANNEEALKTHEWIQHQLASNNIKKYKCYIDYCNVETLRQEVFEAHIDAHPGFQLQCKQCPYRTLDWENFKDHVIDHVKGSDQ